MDGVLIEDKISKLCDAVRKELLENIVPFWIQYTPDKENGGFYGIVGNDRIPDKKADKGLILITRILWTFSALHRLSASQRWNPNVEFSQMAHRAYTYLTEKFLDRESGGVYFLVDYTGNPIVAQKKIYGQAFTIYALAEYYGAFGEKQALQHAKDIYRLIEEHTYDHANTGYFEATNGDWTVCSDMRLSVKDMNEKKSMNTHLHLLEAYANLLKVWPDETLRLRLQGLIQNFVDHIIDPDSLHFRLFFDEFWNSKSRTVSYGHDIEGSWLLCEAVEILGNPTIAKNIHDLAIRMTDATLKQGFNSKDAIYSERFEDGSYYPGTHWWQQAEAMVGVVNAFQKTGDQNYLEWAIRIWNFIASHFVDHEYGEWFYEISQDGRPNLSISKVSEWKCPYHNGRACMEVLKRLL